MAGIEDRISKLEGRICSPDPAAERQRQQDALALDQVTRIIASSSSRATFDDLLAQVKEHRAEMTPYQQQLEVKRLLVLQAPDGARLWRRFVEPLDEQYKP